ncbi:hypothetical protein FRB94_009755 [Tulasnella sp. JGI-2019a]|nr:hypothetical protein FRB94_009755 [Tulasnella sp. JGI-2019a]
MASLTARLHNASEATDSGLDAIFKSSAAASSSRVPVPIPQPTNSSKRKLDSETMPQSLAGKKRAQINLGAKRQQARTDGSRIDRPTKKQKGPVSRTTDEDEGEIERLKPRRKSTGSIAEGAGEVLPMHVSLASDQPSKPRKVKYVPPNETKEEVDARTIFIGNLPVSILKSKSTPKALIKHLTSSLAPNIKWKVESTRYRSVAFNTSAASSHNPDEQTGATQGENEKAGETPTEYLTTNQKKRLAFIKGDLHDKADVTNCYVVFGHTAPQPAPHVAEAVEDPNKNPVPDPDILHPAEIARLVVQDMDASTFQDRTIRVDRVGKAKLADSLTSTSRKDDMKRTVFVGSLAFEATEEDVRAFFEAAVEEERGEIEGGEEEEEEDTDGGGVSGRPKKAWVQSVRVIRDPDTQLGKGIAYVTFRDVECVDEVLALSPEKLSFGRRILRVQRCKTISGPKSKSNTKSALPQASKSIPDSKNNRSVKAKIPIPIPRIPKGDPTLGTRLVGLSTSERKEAKSNDADRVARRLAKKKQRAAMESNKSKAVAGGGSPSSTKLKKGGILGKMPKSKNPLKKAKKAKRV